MPFDATGKLKRLFNWQDDRDANIKIDPERMDGEMDNIVHGINEVVNGNIPVTIKARSGTQANPSYAFEEDENTGLYRSGDNKIGVAIDSNKKIEVTSSGLEVSGKITTDSLEIADPVNAQEAATKNYVDTRDAAARNYVDAQDTATRNYADTQDAATKSQVDNHIANNNAHPQYAKNSNATANNRPNTIVKRDANREFAVDTIKFLEPNRGHGVGDGALAWRHNPENPKLQWLSKQHILNWLHPSASQANGYVYLGYLLIMQWGVSTPNQTVSFPIVFPRSCFIVIGIDQDSSPSAVSVSAVTKSSFRAHGDFNFWMAIGY